MGRVNGTFPEPLAGEPFDLVWCSAVCLQRVTDQDQSQDHRQVDGVDQKPVDVFVYKGFGNLAVLVDTGW
jgi:hypothetical protein